MAESAEQVHARVLAAADEHGRMPLPSVAEWDIFPWEVVDGALVTRPLAPPAPEEPREGEAAADCRICSTDSARVIWSNERWRLKHLDERSGLPLVLILEPFAHLDLPDLDDEMAAEFGTLAVRIVRAVEALPNIARCHASRIGDGATHLHVWFMARTKGLPSVRGSFAVDWDDILPPGPEEPWREDLAAVAASLASYDDRVVD
ncbi:MULTISPECIES: hypothetical protein [unclassified Nocardioides]|uniref:hypothetical protein n=1 Tax=unclassified Nocardioides TaxID=2615069 RepID=UPI0009E8CFC5|nr:MULTISPECIES: hypothetical protein [unclassified Nocardioides]